MSYILLLYLQSFLEIIIGSVYVAYPINRFLVCRLRNTKKTTIKVCVVEIERTLSSGALLLWRTEVTLRQTDWIFLKSPGVEPCCTTPSTFRVSCCVFCTGMGSLGVRGEGDRASWRSHNRPWFNGFKFYTLGSPDRIVIIVGKMA